MTAIVFYISGHGFGHAARAMALIDALASRQPGLDIVVRTQAPRWLFERIERPGVDVLPCETDTGVAQHDAVSLDEDETARCAAEFYRTFERRVMQEAQYVRGRNPALVVADVPPIACAAAHAAGVPSVVVANFTWDWIYSYYPQFEAAAPGVIGTIAQAYASTALALRLPLHGGFESMASSVRDVPFIARRSVRDPVDTRRLLGVDARRPLVLSSFGGYGVRLPYERVAASGLTVVTPERPLPPGLRHEDLVAAADVVVSKPGYGIVSECVAHRTALLYTSRGRFAEYDVMVAELPQMLRCRHVALKDLLAGHWRESIEALLSAPEPREHPRVDGAAVVAEKILELATSSRR